MRVAGTLYFAAILAFSSAYIFCILLNIICFCAFSSSFCKINLTFVKGFSVVKLQVIDTVLLPSVIICSSGIWYSKSSLLTQIVYDKLGNNKALVVKIRVFVVMSSFHIPDTSSTLLGSIGGNCSFQLRVRMVPVRNLAPLFCVLYSLFCLYLLEILLLRWM